MQSDTFIKLQKKFGGMWVATSKSGARVYAAAKNIADVMKTLKRKNITPNKTVIGYIGRYGRTHVYISISVHRV